MRKECPKMKLQCNNCLLSLARCEMTQHQQQCLVYDCLENLRADIKFKEDLLKEREKAIEQQQSTIER